MSANEGRDGDWERSDAWGALPLALLGALMAALCISVFRNGNWTISPSWFALGLPAGLFLLVGDSLSDLGL